jgi:uncharacterized membrane protein YeaQ/YmgE (transglycosylase-associated protein family)
MPLTLFMQYAERRVFIIEWRHGLLGWIIIGLIAGWLAGQIYRGRGFGCIADIILGLVGAVLEAGFSSRWESLAAAFCIRSPQRPSALSSSSPSPICSAAADHSCGPAIGTLALSRDTIESRAMEITFR